MAIRNSPKAPSSTSSQHAPPPLRRQLFAGLKPVVQPADGRKMVQAMVGSIPKLSGLHTGIENLPENGFRNLCAKYELPEQGSVSGAIRR